MGKTSVFMCVACGFGGETHATNWVVNQGDKVGHVKAVGLAELGTAGTLDKDFADEIGGLGEVLVGKRVEDLLAVVTGFNYAIFSEHLEVLAEISLGKTKHALDLRNREFLVSQ